MLGVTELGIMSMLFSWAGLVWLVPALLVIYLVVRWRQERSGVPDPQLGWKVVLFFFLWNAIQLAVFGLALVIYSLLEEGSEPRRLGLSLVVSGLIIGGAHAFGVLKSNHRQFPNVGRMFSGMHLIFFGAIGSAAIIAMTYNLFRVEPDADFGKVAGTGLIVYIVSWVVCALAHRQRYTY
jgi:hypothetical protein